MRESTPDQTPGPSRARWMEGGGTVRLHHQRQLGLLTARGILCMRTLRIPSIPPAKKSSLVMHPRLKRQTVDPWHVPLLADLLTVLQFSYIIFHLAALPHLTANCLCYHS